MPLSLAPADAADSLVDDDDGAASVGSSREIAPGGADEALRTFSSAAARCLRLRLSREARSAFGGGFGVGWRLRRAA